jgi:uncharacterized protein YlxW (UPF0749 family)
MKLAQQKSSIVEEKKVETFESLSEKQANLAKEIAEAESDLKSAQESLSNAKSLNKQVTLGLSYTVCGILCNNKATPSVFVF